MEIEVGLTRRSLLTNSLVVLALPTASKLAFAADEQSTFASAVRYGDGRYGVVLLSADGRILRDVPLSARGHDIAIHLQSGRAVAFARRPGTFAVAFETRSQHPPRVFTSATGYHFFGHGAFSADGRLLYAAENDIAAGAGVIAIYDVSLGYKKIGMHQSYGVGPHEIIMLADGRTLAVANGGLDTVPDAARENLNVSDMQPSLAFVDCETGALIARHDLRDEARQLSIRHLASDRRGRIWFGGQWEGDPGAASALIGSAGIDTQLSFAEMPAADIANLKDYIGSVAISGDGRILAASAPKAGRIVYVDTLTSHIVASTQFRDACGIAAVSDEVFAETSGFGVFRHANLGDVLADKHQLQDVAFDNHLRRLI